MSSSGEFDDARCHGASLSPLEADITPPKMEERALPPWSVMHQCKVNDQSATCVIAICSEGDNSEDGARMVGRAEGGASCTLLLKSTTRCHKI